MSSYSPLAIEERGTTTRSSTPFLASRCFEHSQKLGLDSGADPDSSPPFPLSEPLPDGLLRPCFVNLERVELKSNRLCQLIARQEAALLAAGWLEDVVETTSSHRSSSRILSSKSKSVTYWLNFYFLLDFIGCTDHICFMADL